MCFLPFRGTSQTEEETVRKLIIQGNTNSWHRSWKVLGTCWGLINGKSFSAEKDMGVLSFPTKHSTLTVKKNGPLVYGRRSLTTKLRESVLPYSALVRHVWNSGPNSVLLLARKTWSYRREFSEGLQSWWSDLLWGKSESWHYSSCRKEG